MLVHGWPLVYCYDELWRRWAVTRSTVGSFGIVVFPPPFDDDLGFVQRVEDLSVQQFVAHAPVEALAIAMLPR